MSNLTPDEREWTIRSGLRVFGGSGSAHGPDTDAIVVVAKSRLVELEQRVAVADQQNTLLRELVAKLQKGIEELDDWACDGLQAQGIMTAKGNESRAKRSAVSHFNGVIDIARPLAALASLSPETPSE